MSIMDFAQRVQETARTLGCFARRRMFADQSLSLLGEARKTEKGNVFGSGARTPVAITIMIKNPAKSCPATLRYYDIGDYLSREEKLAIVADLASISGLARAGKWQTLTPNPDHDWINQRDPAFEQFIPIGDKADGAVPIFEQYSGGLKTNRDTWCYGFSRKAVASNMARMLDFYEGQRKSFSRIASGEPIGKRLTLAEEFIDRNKTKIAWSEGLVGAIAKLAARPFEKNAIRAGHYRPFCKQWVYYHGDLNDRVYRLPMLFPKEAVENVAICTTAAGNRDEFSVFIANTLPDVHMLRVGQTGGKGRRPLAIGPRVPAPRRARVVFIPRSFIEELGGDGTDA